jgi:uracil-DNA glycosylase family 4
MSREIDSPTARVVLQKLESLARSGLTHVGRVPDLPPVAVVTPRAASAAKVATAPLPSAAAYSAVRQAAPQAASIPASQPAASLLGKISELPDLSTDVRTTRLDVMRGEVAGCTRCAELARCRTKTVFGVGTVRPRLVFCGEAPGADEDARGEPFVGAAGQLLTKIIQACTLAREDVYILNVLKCRPPGNRVPLPDEVANCRGYLEEQLSILRPEYLCALGATAAKTLLDTQLSIGKLRGKFHSYRGVPVLCTYHPSYLLRNPSAKKDVWDDMKILMQAMGISLVKKA